MCIANTTRENYLFINNENNVDQKFSFNNFISSFCEGPFWDGNAIHYLMIGLFPLLVSFFVSQWMFDGLHMLIRRRLLAGPFSMKIDRETDVFECSCVRICSHVRLCVVDLLLRSTNDVMYMLRSHQHECAFSMCDR